MMEIANSESSYQSWNLKQSIGCVPTACPRATTDWGATGPQLYNWPGGKTWSGDPNTNYLAFPSFLAEQTNKISVSFIVPSLGKFLS